MSATDDFLANNARYAERFDKGHVPLPPAAQQQHCQCQQQRRGGAQNVARHRTARTAAQPASASNAVSARTAYRGRRAAGTFAASPVAEPSR